MNRNILCTNLFFGKMFDLCHLGSVPKQNVYLCHINASPQSVQGEEVEAKFAHARLALEKWRQEVWYKQHPYHWAPIWEWPRIPPHSPAPSQIPPLPVLAAGALAHVSMVTSSLQVEIHVFYVPLCHETSLGWKLPEMVPALQFLSATLHL